MPDRNEVTEAYTAFLHTTKGIVDHRLDSIKTHAEKLHARTLAGPVFKALLDDDDGTAMCAAATRTSTSQIRDQRRFEPCPGRAPPRMPLHSMPSTRCIGRARPGEPPRRA